MPTSGPISTLFPASTARRVRSCASKSGLRSIGSGCWDRCCSSLCAQRFCACRLPCSMALLACDCFAARSLGVSFRGALPEGRHSSRLAIRAFIEQFFDERRVLLDRLLDFRRDSVLELSFRLVKFCSRIFCSLFKCDDSSFSLLACLFSSPWTYSEFFASSSVIFSKCDESPLWPDCPWSSLLEFVCSFLSSNSDAIRSPFFSIAPIMRSNLSSNLETSCFTSRVSSLASPPS
ncbi:hypothetical protein KC341_g72 [Hortaea werneckii]|nr:hypothetical protein KC341_g72 [Hortaea werneckii]